VVDSIRRRVPDSMPLFIRISATDWMEHSPETPQWTIQDSIKLSIILSDLGVDVIDVSSGANNPAQKIILDNYYQINLAEEIKKALKGAGKEMLVAAVGLITNAAVAEEVLQNKKADMVLVGREFLRDPNVVHKWAYELGTKKEWPRQYVRAGPKGSPF
jgi:2,4-dienoyl-CoA reductase-like NADH-dependent reductase (Old Yellow Enzyme family)